MYRSPHVRVSDADREAIVARLSAATAEGRLTITEFSERSQQAYASRTWGELSAIVHDLPSGVVAYAKAPAAPPAALPGRQLPLFALLAGIASLMLVPCFGVGLSAAVAIAAIVLGVKSMRGPARWVRHGRAMAVAGLLCGLTSLVAQAAMFGVFIFADNL